MECEFPGRISAAEIYFVIRKAKTLGRRGIFSYSFHHSVSCKLSYYSSELFVQILDLGRKFPAQTPSQRLPQVSIAQEVSVAGPKGEPPFKGLTMLQHCSPISRLSLSPNAMLVSWTHTK